MIPEHPCNPIVGVVIDGWAHYLDGREPEFVGAR